MLLNRSELPIPHAGKRGWPWDVPVRRLPERMPNDEPWPKITIVTPAYNQAQFLEETMRSVLCQGYPSLEYIVIDDSSTDNTPEIIDKYRPWLAYTARQPNGGQGNAINHGFRVSTGDLMGWLNSDDLLLPRALERSVLARQRDANVKVTCGFREIIDEYSKLIREEVAPWPNNFNVARDCCMIAQETTIWNREVYERVGPIGEGFRYALDYDYWQRMMAHGYGFTLVPYFIGAYRMHSSSKTVTMHEVAEREANEIVCRYLGRTVTGEQARSETTLALQYRIIAELQPTGVFRTGRLAGAVLHTIARLAGLARRFRVQDAFLGRQESMREGRRRGSRAG